MDTDNLPGEGLAIVAITKRGAELGRTLKALLPESHLYLPDRFVTAESERPFPLPAGRLVSEIFGKYRQFALIMAAGIAVRLISSHISDKRSDPAVVVIDDSGKFVISLLSGHIGGANELTGKLAALIGAQPVITTSSDNSGTLSIDLMAKSYGWEIEDGSALTHVSAAIVNGEPVGVYQNAGDTGWQADLAPGINIFPSLDALKQSNCKAAVIITDHLLDALPVPSVILRPRSLVAGIGCNRSTACEDIEEAVKTVFRENRLSIKCIKSLATIDIKKDEVGLLEFAEKYHLPVEYFDRESLSKVAVPSPSAVALKHVGTPTVCEAAAILSSGGSLLVPRTSFKRKVTVAIARDEARANKKSGKLFVVGTGPGDPEHMTLKARQAIAMSEVVVGYKTYIDLIKPCLCGKEVIATAMGSEVERVKRAVDLALQGKTVALISGGDSGVYGMSGLVGEVMQKQDLKLKVEVIPGVPAMIAAGALLGAPLTADVASISLSDHLLPWEEIAQRLHKAAQGDFVIALYNPRSKGRQNQLREAREIVLQYRAPTTPAGIVTSAFRPEQNIVVTDLEHMLDYPIGMNTIVIIGNSTTFTFNDWMVTPRGYQTKYSLVP